MEEIFEAIADLRDHLDSLRPLSKDDERRIMQKFRLDWNYHSNNLEGNSLTYGETKSLLLHGITAQGKPLKDHFEITGHNECIDWVYDIIKTDEDITEGFIKQMHTILLKERYQVDAISEDGQPTKKWIEVGKYKETPNHVKTKTGEIFYFASPEETPAKMHDLMDWYRSKQGELNPVLLAIEFHYRFITIHPFDDGNGRMARLLMNVILMRNGFPPVIIKTEDKENYFAALRQADGGNLEPFIIYVGNNLINSLNIMIAGAEGEDIEEEDDTLKKLKLLSKEIENIGKTKEEVKRTERLVQKLVDGPIYNYLSSLNERLDDFVKLFENNWVVMSGRMRGPGGVVKNYNTNSSLYSINKVLSQMISRDTREIYDEIYIDLCFSMLRGMPFEDGQIAARIMIRFSEDKCLISLLEGNTAIGNPAKLRYGKDYKESHFDPLTKSIVKVLTDQLDMLVAKHR